MQIYLVGMCENINTLCDMQELSPGGRKVINPCPALLPDVRDIFTVSRADMGIRAGLDMPAAMGVMRHIESTPTLWHQRAVS